MMYTTLNSIKTAIITAMTMLTLILGITVYMLVTHKMVVDFDGVETIGFADPFPNLD